MSSQDHDPLVSRMYFSQAFSVFTKKGTNLSTDTMIHTAQNEQNIEKVEKKTFLF